MASAITSALARVPWSYAAPAAITGAAYLDAKYGIRRDITFIRRVFRTIKMLDTKEQEDRFNAFYVLEDQALNPQTADAPAIIFEGRSYSFKDVYESVLRYGQWLKTEHGVVRDEIVAMDFTNKPEFLFIAYGLMSLGAKPAFINYNLSGEALLHCVRTSSARLFIVDEDVENNITPAVREELGSASFRSNGKGAVETTIFSVKTEIRIAAFDLIREPDSARNNQLRQNVGCLIYTSGTTGFPKAATVSWAKMHSANSIFPEMLGLKPGERFYTGMPLYHSAAFILGWTNTLASGATLVLSRKFSLKKFWHEVHESDATVIQYVGETLRYLLSAPPSPLDKGHKVRVAYGNGLRPDIWAEFKQRFGIDTIVEFYGATEGPGTMTNVSSNSFSEGAVGWTGSLIRAVFPNRTALVVLDPETDEPLRDPATGFARKADRAKGEVGELMNALENVDQEFQGYFGNKDATNKKVIRSLFAKGDAWYRTGDVMRQDTENRTYFVDRIGDTFRWKSENVSTFEVQEAIGRHGSVADATVYGVALPKHDGRAGCAAIVTKDGQNPAQGLLDDLAKYLEKNLPTYARPIFLRAVKELEVTGTGKHVKTKLRIQGVDPAKTSESGDHIYWLQQGRYVPFTETEWKKLEGGAVKL